MQSLKTIPLENVSTYDEVVAVNPDQAERIEAVLGMALHNIRRLSTHPHLSSDLRDVVQAVIAETEKGLDTVRTIVRGKNA
jgi:hypothetical protein